MRDNEFCPHTIIVAHDPQHHAHINRSPISFAVFLVLTGRLQ